MLLRTSAASAGCAAAAALTSARTAPGGSDAGLRWPASRASRRLEALVRGVLGRRLLHLRPQIVGIRLDPVGYEHPLLAVPLLDARLAGAAVVETGHLQRPDQSLETELLDAIGGEVEVLE